MLTTVDHVVIGVVEIDGAVDTFHRLGFTLSRVPGEHVARAFFGDFHLELRQSDDAEGIQRVVLRSDDLDADVARLREVGNPGAEAIDDAGRRLFALETPVPIGLVDRAVPHTMSAAHPNTATVLERIYVAVESIEDTVASFEALLGLPAPEPEMGTVIMSLMAVFDVGHIGVAVAEPRGPGPTADALAAHGEGWFQLLFRAEDLDVAARLMVDNGMRPPVRGTRLRGQSALLVEPDQACNVYVALAGDS